MPEIIDPAIKLFGTDITSPENDDFKEPQVAAPPPTIDSMETSPKAIKMPEEPFTLRDSVHGNGTPVLESFESMSPAQQNTKAVDKNAEASKVAAIKKPDKILPCPRCNSTETKFCYFNNYNVNQPRHFCRGCQRYWTAGGSIRKVPVGAGRRKNKHPSSQLRPVRISSDGPEKQLLEASNVPSQSCSSARENEVSQEVVQIEQVGLSEAGFTPTQTLQYFPFSPDYPLDFGGTGNPLLLQWNYQTAMVPGLCMPNIIVPFVPPMCWGWDSSCSGHTSSSLGKHSRDLNSQEEKNEKCLWVPKTLRIDDPKEAAKSSIWSTLGIKPGKRSEPISKGGMFKAFQSTTEGVSEAAEVEKTMQVNPAAVSRSQRFQESA